MYSHPEHLRATLLHHFPDYTQADPKRLADVAGMTIHQVVESMYGLKCGLFLAFGKIHTPYEKTFKEILT